MEMNKKLKVGKNSGLRYFDIEDVRGWKPCYSPERYLVAGKRYNSVKILQDERIPMHDRLWVVLRTDLVSEKVMRLFAVWSARQVQHLMKDPRSIAALEVAERFANGQATAEELNDANAAAYASAAASAAYAYASAAPDAAAYASAAASRSAAAYESYDAAAYASAAPDAAAYASAAASAAAAQVSKLIEMVVAEGKERRK
jgi:hypothetical protein